MSTGTDVRRQRLSPANLPKYRFPLLPRPVETRLLGIVTTMNAIVFIQATPGTELEALLPAVLNRAFAGGL